MTSNNHYYQVNKHPKVQYHSSNFTIKYLNMTVNLKGTLSRNVPTSVTWTPAFWNIYTSIIAAEEYSVRLGNAVKLSAMSLGNQIRTIFVESNVSRNRFLHLNYLNLK